MKKINWEAEFHCHPATQSNGAGKFGIEVEIMVKLRTQQVHFIPCIFPRGISRKRPKLVR